MRPMRIALLLAVTALAASMLPAAAENMPAACSARVSPLDLAEGEVLIERTLHFTGESRVGNVDANRNPQALRMVEEAPTGEEAKVFASRVAAPGRPDDAKSEYAGHFSYEFDQQTRVVCASVDFWAASAASSMGVQLFFDAEGIGSNHVEYYATAVGSGVGDVTRRYGGTFRNVEGTAWEITVQFAPASPGGASVLYDSVDFPSSATIVTVEQE